MVIASKKQLHPWLPSKVMLTIPENYTVEEIKSGCCGMAGAFGYEKKHYELSMKIGELVLFPAVRNARTGYHYLCIRKQLPAADFGWNRC